MHSAAIAKKEKVIACASVLLEKSRRCEISYIRKIEYRVVPDQSFDIIYNCSGCGCKTSYKNTNRFRVNANGNKLDVWLIYQCSKCKHTKNLGIYERQNPAKIPSKQYQLYLTNDEELALEYGTNYSFFRKNQVEVDNENIFYHYENDDAGQELAFGEGDMIVIENPYGLRIRAEKIAAEVLKLSRSRIKKLLDTKKIVISQSDRSIFHIAWLLKGKGNTYEQKNRNTRKYKSVYAGAKGLVR